MLTKLIKKYGICALIVLYIWYKEYQFNHRLQEFECILMKAVRFWKEKQANK